MPLPSFTTDRGRGPRGPSAGAGCLALPVVRATHHELPGDPEVDRFQRTVEQAGAGARFEPGQSGGGAVGGEVHKCAARQPQRPAAVLDAACLEETTRDLAILA